MKKNNIKVKIKGKGKKTKSTLERIQILEKNSSRDGIMIGKLIRHLNSFQKTLFNVNIINACISKVLVESKLITREDLDKMCNEELAKALKEIEEKRLEAEKDSVKKEKKKDDEKTEEIKEDESKEEVKEK